MLVSLTAAVTLETFRVLLPVMYGLADRRGTTRAAGIVLLVFASSVLAPAVRRVLGPRLAVVVTVGALAAWRVAVPWLGNRSLLLAVFGTVAALWAMTLLLTAELPQTAEVTGIALLVGLGLDAAVRTGFFTWDPVWQSGVLPLLVALVLAGALFASVATFDAPDSAFDAQPAAITTVGSGTALGAVLAVEFLFLLSPAFVASSAAISLPWSALVVPGGLVLAVASFRTTWFARTVRLGLPVGLFLAASGFLLPAISGAPVVLVVAAGQIAAGATLSAAFRPRRDRPVRGELGVALGWMVLALTVLLYQIHFDQPLPFDNRWIVVGAGVLAVLAAYWRPVPAECPSPPRPARLAAAGVLVVAVLVASGLAVTGHRDTVAPGAGTALRVVEWNVRQAVTAGKGQLDPAEIAAVLSRGGKPDIVVLPEAVRGWPLSGDIDLASWLSRRLDMPFLWSPAAGDQFGTLVLTRLPIVSSGVERLPVAGRAQGRSLLHAILDLGDGRRLTLLATHLQHRNDGAAMEARMQEIGVVVRQWAGAPHTILVGDFNPRQGDVPDFPPRVPGAFEEVRAILDAGFTTAHDLAHCSAPTSGPNCSDFVFVTPDLRQEVQVSADVGLFDHRPVVSTITMS